MSTGLRWHHARGVLDCGRGRLVGIVNANPDSFSDAGAHAGTDAAIAHGRRLADEGADVVEVGGESLRFSEHTPVEVEVGRVVPVIEALAAELDVPVAVDTFKPEVARAGIAAGAAILNDPTRLREPAMAAVAAEGGVGVVLTHFFGPPKVRPTSFPDGDVPDAVVAWAREALLRAGRRGSRRSGSSSIRGWGSARRRPRTSTCCGASTRSWRSAAPSSSPSPTRRCWGR